MNIPRNNSGVALITMLLVVVIATILGVYMVTNQKFAISRAQAFFEQTIVRQYAYGGEELARQILHQDFLDSPETDHFGELWAGKELTFDFEEGEVELVIEDLQSRLNINAMLLQGPQGILVRSRFQSLLAELGMDHAYVDRILDWIDENDSVSALGAEDYDYLGLERPYRTSGQPMVDVSELRLILEMDQTQYLNLAPFVSAVLDPTTAINVNTASPQILQTVAPGLSIDSAIGIVSVRDQGQPYLSVSDFTGEASLGGSANSINTQGLSVQSSFFQVSIRARYQNRIGYLTSIIQRDLSDGSIRVVYRDQSKKVLPLAEGPVTPGSVTSSSIISSNATGV